MSDEGGDIAVFVGFDAYRRVHGHEHSAFCNCAFNFFGLSGHIHLATAVDAGHTLGTEANRGAGHVHGHIATTDDDHIFTLVIWDVVIADFAQELDCACNALAFFTRNPCFFIVVCTDGDIDAVKILVNLIKGNILADGAIGMDFNPKRED